MKLHPRHLPVATARHEISVAVTDAWERHRLTPTEVVVVLAQLTSEYSKYPLRDERHPGKSGKKADEA